MADDIFKGTSLTKLNLTPELKNLINETTQATVDYSSFHSNIIAQQNEHMAMIAEVEAAKLQKEMNQIAREERQIELLEEIKNNTGSLVNIVDMIRFNSNQQTDILIIITEIMKLGTFNNKDEAEKSFRGIMDSINQKVEDIESATTLFEWANATWIYIKNQYFGG